MVTGEAPHFSNNRQRHINHGKIDICVCFVGETVTQLDAALRACGARYEVRMRAAEAA
jgi:hypothetical protein